MAGSNVRVVNGLTGWDEVSDTAAKTGVWESIEVIADAKFAALTAANATGFGSNAVAGSATTYVAGHVIPGNITAFQLHSGRVRAYRKSN